MGYPLHTPFDDKKAQSVENKRPGKPTSKPSFDGGKLMLKLRNRPDFYINRTCETRENVLKAGAKIEMSKI